MDRVRVHVGTNGVKPTKAYVGYHLYSAAKPVTIHPHETKMIDTKVYVIPPPGYYLQLVNTYSLVAEGLTVAPSVMGGFPPRTIKVFMQNTCPTKSFTVFPRSQIAKFMFVPIKRIGRRLSSDHQCPHRCQPTEPSSPSQP